MRTIFLGFFEGVPIPKGRPRLTAAKGRVFAFTPKKTRDYETLLANFYRSQKRITKPETGAIYLQLKVLLRRPKNASKRVFPTVRPDLDNYLKTILDAANGILWVDDGQVTKVSCSKEYDNSPAQREGVIISVHVLDEVTS